MRRPIAGALLMVAILIVLPVQAQQTRPERIAGQPNLNGIWQALGSAYWNVEAHAAEALTDFWQLGAIGAIPAGRSIVDGGTIPYLPEALAKREENRAGWPATDPVTSCYLPGIPRATYMPFPFQIVQGGGNILFVYEYASTNRMIYLTDHIEPPVDTWMGRSNGHWEGDTLVVETTGFNGKTWFDRAGNHHSLAMRVTERFELTSEDHIQYDVTIEDPITFSRPWRMEMPLYRHVEPDAQLLEYKCVPFVEEMLYKDLELAESP